MAWPFARRAHAAPPSAPPSTAIAEAVMAERQRIYRELHDDLGAKLLDLVYGANTPDQADRAREALAILRDVVSRAERPPGHLLALLDELHAEARQRLSALGLALDWQQAEDLPNPLLDQARVLHLARLLREAISNALRHSGTMALRVRISTLAQELVLDITDYGQYDAERIGDGQGTRNMREHAAGLGGGVAWDAGTQGGTKVLLRVPLAG